MSVVYRASRYLRSKMSKERVAPNPTPTQSKIHPEYRSSGDSRELLCLIEGDSALFTVEVPSNCTIPKLKKAIHEAAVNGGNHAIYAKYLVHLK
jgi:hypothetical protein